MSNQRPTDVYPKGPATEEELLQATTLLYYLHETNPGYGPDSRQDRPGGAGQYRSRGTRPREHPSFGRERRDLPRVRPGARAASIALLARQPAGTRAGCDRLSGLLLSFPSHEDGAPRLELRVVHDRLGLPLRRDAHLRGLLRRRHRGGGRDPPAGRRALSARGLAVDAGGRHDRVPRLAARDGFHPAYL